MSFSNTIFFFLGSVGLTFYIQEKIIKLKNYFFLPLSFILILNIIIILSYLICFYLFEYIYFLKIIFYFINLFVLYLYFVIKKNSFKFTFNFELIFLILIFLIILFSLDLPPTDNDSLDYHLGAPKNWLENKGFSPNLLWDHHYLVGSGEFLNFFGLYNELPNFTGLTQLIFIFLLFISLNLKERKISSKNIFFILILFSNPLVLPLLISQKPFLVPILTFFSIYLCLKELKINLISKSKNIFLLLIISGLNFSLSSKYSFIIPFIIFEIYLFILFKKEIKKLILVNFFIFLFISFPIYFKNYYFYGNPLSPFFENNFASNLLSIEKIKFANYLKGYHSYYANFYEYINNIVKIFIPNSLGTFFTIVTPALFLIFFIKFEKKDMSMLIIFGAILFINLILGQHTARYYLIVGIPFMYIISQRFTFNNLYKFILFALCLPQLISIIFLLFNYYSDSKDNFLSKYANEYNQVKWMENNINEKYITDLRMNYYADKKINISLLKWSENYSEEISKVVTKNEIKYALISDNKKHHTVFSKHFLSCGDYIKEINLPYATRNYFNKLSNYKMRLIKINKKCLK